MSEPQLQIVRNDEFADVVSYRGREVLILYGPPLTEMQRLLLFINLWLQIAKEPPHA